MLKKKKIIQKTKREREILGAIFHNTKELDSITECLTIFTHDSVMNPSLIESCDHSLKEEDPKKKQLTILIWLSIHSSVASWASKGKCTHEKNHWKELHPIPSTSLISYLQAFFHLWFHIYMEDFESLYKEAEYIYIHRWSIKDGLDDPWGYDWEEKKKRSESVLCDSGILSLIGDPVPSSSFGFKIKEEDKKEILTT